jgi:uncharacterized protein (TIGR03000 family)
MSQRPLIGRTAALAAAVGLLLVQPPAGAADQAPARIVVKVPADAQVTIGGQATAQTGPLRVYESPPLQVGKTYAYTVRATWTENGQARTAEREITVQAGRETVVDLTLPAAAAQPAGPPKTREFLFTYQATVTGLAPKQTARIWLPVPPSNEEQQVTIVKKDLPAGAKLTREPKYGNEMFYVEATAGPDGTIPLAVTYRVKRYEVRGPSKDEISREEAELFLKPDKLVPIGGKPATLLAGRRVPENPFDAARVMYDVVLDHMRYSKEGSGWGLGDAEWACDSRYGNCSDFHSVFISMARTRKIPAKFVMGFPIPEQRGQGEVGGYHCWAYFKPAGKGWVPVDISEADKIPKLREYYFGNLTEDRVAFTIGRDIDLVPRQDGPALNFFIYPYVEVDGQPYTKVERKFFYRDVGTE